jgi:hypothetical protein
MTRAVQSLAISVVVTSSLLVGASQTSDVARAPYVAAELRPGSGNPPDFVLALYPVDGSPITIPAPELPRNFDLVGYSSDGDAIYVTTKDAHGLPVGGVTKLMFKPTRLVTLAGSSGLGAAWVTAPPNSSKVYVSGSSRSESGGWRCGVFEIDSSGGSFRALRSGGYQPCDGQELAGPVSMDGTRVLTYQDRRLKVFNLRNGSAYSLGPGLSRGSWSPDGKWIAAWGAGSIVLIDADDLSHRESLGSCCDGDAHWSPDSKYLLLAKRELRCSLTLYFATLEILDIGTGERTVIKSSRCNTGGWVGWVDRRALE